ncbi:RNA-binding domain-containing protein [Hymenobacter defluvii]|uniref:DNA binding domain-containing protein n=1 Tax=Hymenobacter defluvii TaxID=2054411 RepID=A0ABS3T8W4_9BACT|nr:RNA-binding domain-containing protein [Hymenobacter defluvii]MBO3270080.1 putative DNA binding domain-containing protein [Hymenobacter defluvii]
MTLDDLQAQRESADFEAKAAQGQDGRGALPHDIWPTYSAFANTNGGVIVLGVKERKDHSLQVIGLQDAEKLRREVWSNVHNRKTISHSLLGNDDVRIETIDGLDVLFIRVPKAHRHQRPIYVGENPLTGTYQRRHEGDYSCPAPRVRQLIAEAENDTRDARPLPHHGISDLDSDSLAAFRNQFRSTKPGHAWLVLSDQDLLQRLGGWFNNRETGEQGLTLAGLLMFGQQHIIESILPDYVVDYQEKSPSHQRWVDRLVTDGTWSGNLYDFYRKAYSRLISDLKVPFQLRDQHQRVDETPVHVALREALVNSLIHADYNGSSPILIVKEPDQFTFRNPGTLRIPREEVFQGGNSDCRNRNLQKMFQMIGEGEKAGSGFPAILRAWESQSWSDPYLTESPTSDYVSLQLKMTSFLPQDVLNKLAKHFGAPFTELDENARLALVLAEQEGYVTNERFRSFTYHHPADITKQLALLVRNKFLTQERGGRWTKYHLVSSNQIDTLETSIENKNALHDEVNGQLVLIYDNNKSIKSVDNSINSSADSIKSVDNSINSSADSINSVSESTETTEYSSVSDLVRANIPEVIWQKLMQLGEPARLGRISSSYLAQLIFILCSETELNTQQLAMILKRNAVGIRSNYIAQMVEQGVLIPTFPDKLNHPRQAYRAA